MVVGSSWNEKNRVCLPFQAQERRRSVTSGRSRSLGPRFPCLSKEEQVLGWVISEVLCSQDALQSPSRITVHGSHCCKTDQRRNESGQRQAALLGLRGPVAPGSIASPRPVYKHQGSSTSDNRRRGVRLPVLQSCAVRPAAVGHLRCGSADFRWALSANTQRIAKRVGKECKTAQ